jgi:hypothetical protein
MAPAAILGARAHVLAGVAAGAVTYLLVLKAVGGLYFELAELNAARGGPRGGV